MLLERATALLKQHHRIHMKYLLVLLSGAIIISCGSDSEDIPALSKVKITPIAGDRIDLNTTINLALEGYDESGKVIDIDESVDWSSSNSNTSVDQNGVVAGMVVGSSIIKATVGDLSDSYTVNVWDSSAPRTEYYVSDAGNVGEPPFQILRFDANGTNPTVFIDQNLAWPQDILFLEDQEIVLISNLISGIINRHDINSGRLIDSFASGISGPTRMKIGPDGLLYVLQWSGNGRVLRYELDGTFVDQFTDTEVNQSIGLDWDSDGNLYVSSYNNGANGFVRKFDASGKDMGLLISSGLNGPTNIWFDSNERLMINDWSAGVIFRYDLISSALSTVATGLNRPEGVANLPGGNYLIGNGGTGAIKLYSSSNNFVRDFVSSESGGLITPNAIAVRVVN